MFHSWVCAYGSAKCCWAGLDLATAYGMDPGLLALLILGPRLKRAPTHCQGLWLFQPSGQWRSLATQLFYLLKTSSLPLLALPYGFSVPPCHLPQCPSISCLGMTEMQSNCVIVLSSWVPKRPALGSGGGRNNLSLEFYQSMDCSAFHLISLTRIHRNYANKPWTP